MSSVDHLFRNLVQVLAADDPERLDGPIQISELYQTILPYRTYRRALQFDTNQDYEMAVLQLLAGEGGYASVEPVEVRDALEREARAINPNPGTFRDFAAARVRLNPEAVESVIEASRAYAPPRAVAAADDSGAIAYAPPSAAFEPMELPETAMKTHPNDETITPPPAPTGPTAPTFFATDHEAPPATTTSSEETAGVCPFCDQSLPTGRTVTFCPFCGGRVIPRTCDQCGDELEPDWRYCPACGTASSDG